VPTPNDRSVSPSHCKHGQISENTSTTRERCVASIAIDVENSENSPVRGWIFQAMLRSYSTSFLSHALLLIALAIIGIAQSKPETISFEGASIDSIELESLDVAIDSIQFDSVSESEPPEELLTTLDPSLDEGDCSIVDRTGNDFYASDRDLERLSMSGIASHGIKRGASEGVAADRSLGDGDSVDFFGLSARGKSFVFVIDCSGSMSGQRWSLTKQELFKSLDSLTPDKAFLVLLYNSDTWAMFNTRAKDTFLVEATKEKIAAAKRWVNNQMPRGSTFPRFAMESALSLRPDAIFLLSDGEFQDNTVLFLESANVVYTDDLGIEQTPIPIHTLAMDMSFGMFALKRIADNNGGAYQTVNSQ
jgi:hypothetical protein